MIFLDLFYRSKIISLKSLKNSKIKEKFNFKLIILLLMLIMLLKALYFLLLFHSIYSKLILKILNYVYMNCLDIVHIMLDFLNINYVNYYKLNIRMQKTIIKL